MSGLVTDEVWFLVLVLIVLSCLNVWVGSEKGVEGWLGKGGFVWLM